jgi:hypothetical protein
MPQTVNVKTGADSAAHLIKLPKMIARETIDFVLISNATKSGRSTIMIVGEADGAAVGVEITAANFISAAIALRKMLAESGEIEGTPDTIFDLPEQHRPEFGAAVCDEMRRRWEQNCKRSNDHGPDTRR